MNPDSVGVRQVLPQGGHRKFQQPDGQDPIHLARIGTHRGVEQRVVRAE